MSQDDGNGHCPESARLSVVRFGTVATNLLARANVRRILQAEGTVTIQVDITIGYMAGQIKAARVLRSYMIVDGTAGNVIARDEHEIISADRLTAAAPEEERAGVYRERPARNRMTLVDATIRGRRVAWGGRHCRNGVRLAACRCGGRGYCAESGDCAEYCDRHDRMPEDSSRRHSSPFSRHSGCSPIEQEVVDRVKRPWRIHCALCRSRRIIDARHVCFHVWEGPSRVVPQLYARCVNILIN